MAKHILFMRTLGKLVGQMIPNLYTEERTVIVKKKDGAAQAIRINKPVPTGKLLNNIKDLSNKYLYEITAGPSSEMQKQNDREMLQQAYAIPQIGAQIAANTVDIYMKLLNSNESLTISRRVAPLVNPLLKQYANGEISEEEFTEGMKAEQQKAKQEMMNNPEAQSLLMVSQAEMGKAQAAQKSAEAKIAQMQIDYQTKMIELDIEKQRLIKEAVEAEQKMKLALFEIMKNSEDNQRDREVELLTAQLDRQHQLVQGLMNNAKPERTNANTD